jgi:hypothetical protein
VFCLCVCVDNYVFVFTHFVMVPVLHCSFVFNFVLVFRLLIFSRIFNVIYCYILRVLKAAKLSFGRLSRFRN